MCQLLGMSANTPTDIGFSFSGFKERGGNTDHHSDGFGIAFFEPSDCQPNIATTNIATTNIATTNIATTNIATTNIGIQASTAVNANQQARGLRLFHDDRPSFESPVATLIQQHPIKAINVVAHIRKATQGRTCLENTHPFVREVWGEHWVFAHNGQMSEQFLKLSQRLQDNGNANYYQPVGTTDSEVAFCYLLNRLKSTFNKRPSDEALFTFLTTQCRYLSANGLFNCLLSNGDWQMAYASTLLFYLTRKAPFGEAKLADDDLSIDFSEVTTDTDKVSIIVTIPLTNNEPWQQLAVDECMVFRDGDVIFSDAPSQKKYLTIEQGVAIARQVGASV